MSRDFLKSLSQIGYPHLGCGVGYQKEFRQKYFCTKWAVSETVKLSSEVSFERHRLLLGEHR